MSQPDLFIEPIHPPIMIIILAYIPCLARGRMDHNLIPPLLIIPTCLHSMGFEHPITSRNDRGYLTSHGLDLDLDLMRLGLGLGLRGYHKQKKQ